MIVRRAALSDLSEIVALGARIVPKTNLARFPYNAVIARRTTKRAMTDANSRVWVTESEDGKLKGVLIGEIADMPMTHYQCATDLIFIAEAGGDLLLDAFIHWCGLRKVARIYMGISTGTGREEATKRLFARKGLAHCGPMFVMDLGELP